MNELKPCPFCGGDNITDVFIRDGRRVICCDCGAAIHAYQPNATEKAIKAWNIRKC